MSGDWSSILALLGKVSGTNPQDARSDDDIPWQLYRDLARDCMERPLVIAQIGQSLDGRIATASGHSHYINGPESLDHLHRLRAIADAVIVGANTAVLDNPRLTTRRVTGPNPVRVVIDPKRRVPAEHALLAEPDAETLLVTGLDISELPPHCSALAQATGAEQVAPDRLLEQLRSKGLRTILIEGGGNTISRFLSADLIDRLHIAVAPMLIGSGRPGLVLPEIETLAEARRFEAQTYKLGSDTLFDCRLS
ncbi:RibD family protein [Nisaea nitritireducens]|uniref:RibD family protein n=1 Tax=Nisaea nitritireducens TaxID=568392 RepID=UPI001866AB8E|nr:RibD family protein [Nisaea nitritireducens]